MEDYLIISNTTFLLRVAAQQIAYICSDGSYSVLKLVDGDEYTFSFNLAVFEKKIVEQLPDSAHLFARIGRNYIINSQYIFSMDAKLQWSSHDGKWGLRLNGSNIFNNQFDTRSVQGNQDYRMKINYNWASFNFAVIYKFGGYKEKNIKEVDTSRMGH